MAANNSFVRFAPERLLNMGWGRVGLTDGWSVSGGFAIVQPNSQLSINAVEGFPLEDFSEEAVKSQLSESQKIASGGGSEQDIAEAKIEVEVSRIAVILSC